MSSHFDIFKNENTYFTNYEYICIHQELADIRAAGIKSFRDIVVDEANILIWTGLIVPVCIINIAFIKTAYTDLAIFDNI